VKLRLWNTHASLERDPLYLDVAGSLEHIGLYLALLEVPNRCPRGDLFLSIVSLAGQRHILMVLAVESHEEVGLFGLKQGESPLTDEVRRVLAFSQEGPRHEAPVREVEGALCVKLTCYYVCARDVLVLECHSVQNLPRHQRQLLLLVFRVELKDGNGSPIDYFEVVGERVQRLSEGEAVRPEYLQ